MRRSYQHPILTGWSAALLLSIMVALVLGCSALKSRKGDASGEGVTFSLDELDYVEGLAQPLPEKEAPPSEAASPAAPPQVASPYRAGSPSPLVPGISRQPRIRLFLFPFGNTTGYPDRPYGEMVTQKVVQALEQSDRVVVLESGLLEGFASENGMALDDLLKPPWVQRLHRAFGVQGVVHGSLTQLNVASTESAVSRDIEVGLAVARIRAYLVDASTGATIRTYSARNPLYRSKEIGEFNQERAILRAIDIGVEEVAAGLLDSLGYFDWFARVVRIDAERVYIDAGQESGLLPGEVLDVYGPGEEIVNPVTRVSLGWAPGPHKGRIRVSGFFGTDGAYATPLEGNGFEPRDMVKISQTQE